MRTAEERFNTLILPHRAALMARARRLTNGNMAEAEDLVQETLIRAYAHIGKIVAEATLLGWLYTILRHVHYNRYRRYTLRSPSTLSLDAPNGEYLQPADSKTRADIPEAMVARRHEERAVLAALARIPANFRDPIVLADIEEMSYQDIANRLSVPIGTVRSRIARGRIRMRRVLASWDYS